MRALAESWPDTSIVQQLIGQIPWGHNITLLTKVKDSTERELGVGPGDEVIGSSLTFIASISPVIFLGAGLVFIDCDRESWNMDPDLLAAELEAGERRGKLPKAVIPTDLYGQCADYDRIFNICNSYGVRPLQDSNYFRL